MSFSALLQSTRNSTCSQVQFRISAVRYRGRSSTDPWARQSSAFQLWNKSSCHYFWVQSEHTLALEEDLLERANFPPISDLLPLQSVPDVEQVKQQIDPGLQVVLSALLLAVVTGAWRKTHCPEETRLRTRHLKSAQFIISRKSLLFLYLIINFVVAYFDRSIRISVLACNAEVEDVDELQLVWQAWGEVRWLDLRWQLGLPYLHLSYFTSLCRNPTECRSEMASSACRLVFMAVDLEKFLQSTWRRRSSNDLPTRLITRNWGKYSFFSWFS